MIEEFDNGIVTFDRSDIGQVWPVGNQWKTDYMIITLVGGLRIKSDAHVFNYHYMSDTQHFVAKKKRTVTWLLKGDEENE